MTDQVIDLTDSFTLVDHTALSDVVIELDDTLNEPNNSNSSPRFTSPNDADASIIVVSDLITSDNGVARSRQRKKPRSSRKKMEQIHQPRDGTNIERFRDRSPLDSHVGDCPICLERIGTQPLASTRCGHVFCQQCLKIALSLEKKCPTCRKALRGQLAYHPIFLNRG